MSPEAALHLQRSGVLILLIHTLAVLRKPVDIPPSIEIPIIGVAWRY